MDDYYDLGSYSRKVSTRSAAAQTWFDRGLNWLYAFNQEDAEVCFRNAVDADPGCAMAWWGLAYSIGPYYNWPWEKFDATALGPALRGSYDAARTALGLRDGVSGPERALIDAMARRSPSPSRPADFQDWIEDYACAMREAYHAWPHDLDIATLFADAVMTRTPWKLWNLRTGLPAEGASTLEARAVLESALRQVEKDGAPPHPGLLHFYIHLLEMSPFPERALRAGDQLYGLMPDAGHLHHMPTHIDFQCGHYHNVVFRNASALVADRKHVAREGGLNLYAYSRVHNAHFMLYGAMFLGQSRTSMEAADEIVASLPEALLRIESPPMADILEGYVGMKMHALIRFGKWQEIIGERLPTDTGLYCVTVALGLYAKAVAYAATGDIPAAEEHREHFEAARERVPQSRLLFNNTCRDVLAIASEMVCGEIDYRKGNHATAFDHLRNAVALEDNLPYDEPWGWMQPTRHALGALLLEQGEAEQAEAVYRSDLGFDPEVIRARRHPENVWALHGLHESLIRQGKEHEASLIAPRLDLALARADVTIESSCYCRMHTQAR